MTWKPTRPVMDRFMARVQPEPNTGCWLWSGHVSQGGYGRFPLTKYIGVQAHRLAYERLVGPIPAGLDLDHLCRVRCCVNPDHLEPVTRSENCSRGLSGHHMKGRTHCGYGHEFTPENTVIAGGSRHCRLCRNRIRRERYARVGA